MNRQDDNVITNFVPKVKQITFFNKKIITETLQKNPN